MLEEFALFDIPNSLPIYKLNYKNFLPISESFTNIYEKSPGRPTGPGFGGFGRFHWRFRIFGGFTGTA